MNGKGYHVDLIITDEANELVNKSEEKKNG